MICMRVITGSARGRNLKMLDGLETRPTSQKTKEALFSVIQFDIEGRRVLDLFAGSGQLGIEALSRGAESAVFVDSSKRAVSIIKENIALTGFGKSSSVFCREWKTYVASCREKFNIIFLDPPYSKGILKEALPMASGLLCDGGILLCEHDVKDEMPPSLEGLCLFKKKNYGRIALSFYRKEFEKA